MNRSAVKALFSGHVQGVGFRFTASGLASRYDVTGYVRNLPDGRVELVAEGDRAEVNRFLEAIRLRMGGLIRDEQAIWSPASGAYSGFSIGF